MFDRRLQEPSIAEVAALFGVARDTLIRLSSLLAVFLVFAPVAACAGDGAELADVRAKGLFCVRLITSLQFSFVFQSDDGWQSNVQFYQEGDRFRVNRVETVGLLVQGRRMKPGVSECAFNGKRQQFFIGERSWLRLKDGLEGAEYGAELPQIIMYGWLPNPGRELLWHEIRDPSVWQKAFADATYVGSTIEDRMRLDIVEFPQRRGVKTPCIFRVYFAPQLGYAPLRYDRVVEATRELASSMRVDRYKVLEIKKNRLAIPIDVTFKQTDKDRVGLALTWNWKVAEDTLRANQDIDDTLFTIDERKAKEVLDFDKVTHGQRR